MRRVDIVHLFAGSMVLLSSLLGFFHHAYWLFITMFVGANLLQWSFTGFCPLEQILKKLGW
jgi:hypothetical protein